MKDNPEIIAVSDRALELIMRDVLDGLFELSLESSYTAECEVFEILEIRPDHQPRISKTGDTDEKINADIIEFPGLKRAFG